MTDTKKIIEINGIKMEVDLRYATQVYENIKIGSRVKILDKEYTDSKVHHGVVVAFDNFKDRPTITVLAVKQSYGNAELQFYYIHEGSKAEMVPAMDWLPDVEKGKVVDKLEREIAKKQAEIEDLEARRNFFIQQFGKFFEEHTPQAS